MGRKKKPEPESTSPEDGDADILLVKHNDPDPRMKDRWTLASVRGGVDKITVERKGNTTIIKVVSPEGLSFLDTPNLRGGWQRPKREWRSRHPSQPKVTPS